MFYGKKGDDRVEERSTTVVQSTAPIKEAPNTLRSRQTIHLVDLLCEGEIEGLVNGAKSIYLDDTPLQASNGSFNFQGVNWSFRRGQASHSPITGFPNVEKTVSVGVQVKDNTPISRTISDPNVTAVRVNLRFNAMVRQKDNGQLVGTSVAFAIKVTDDTGTDYATINNVDDTRNIRVSGKTVSPYEISYRIELDAGEGPWTVTVDRGTPDNDDDSTINDAMFWSSYTELIDNKFEYPDSAHMGISFDSQLFGRSVPTRSYEIKGIKCQIPNNYNPETRVYTGTWSGTFTEAYTNNPAWVLYDLLTNSRYGLGEFIDADKVDKFALYDIAQYCDELVDDGNGGKEPRYTFNGIIQTRREAYDVINSIVSAFQGMVYWGSGSITVTQDKDADPVKLVTPANVIDGEINYTTAPLNAQHSAVLVSWNNPEDGYKSAIAVVEDKALIDRIGYKTLETAAVGCTSEGQAIRYGKWILDTEKNQTEAATYKAGLDHADVRPGDIVLIQDPNIADVEFGGRIKSVTISTDETDIELDRSVTLSSGQTYSISIVMPDNTITEADITTSPGTYTTITIDQALSDVPIPGAVWVITASNVAPQKYRVVSVKESDKHLFEISAIIHDPNKYARIESDFKVSATPFTLFPSGPLPAATNLQIQEYLYKAGPSVKSALTLSWQPPDDSRVEFFDVLVKRSDAEDFQFLQRTSGVTVDILDTVPDEYTFKVVSVDGLGGNTSTSQPYTFDVFGLLAKPSAVENFTINVVGTTAHLSWDEPPELDVDHYLIKFNKHTSGVTWANSFKVLKKVSKGTSTVSLPSAVGTYSIKAVDTSGLESENASFIVSTIGQIFNLNIIETLIEDSDFAGTRENVTLNSTQLQLNAVDSVDDWYNVDDIISWDIGENGIHSSGIYYFANSIDLGGVFTSRLTPDIVVSGSDIFNKVDLWENVDNVSSWDGADNSDWDISLEVRYTSDDPDDTDVSWSAWQELIISDYTARAFEFRLKFTSNESGITPVVTRLRVEVDMPDRVIDLADQVIPVNGTTITFDNPFRVAPTIAIGAQDLETGDVVTITNKTTDGFTAEVTNNVGGSKEATADFIIKGYGFKTT